VSRIQNTEKKTSRIGEITERKLHFLPFEVMEWGGGMFQLASQRMGREGFPDTLA
jgi:hypothetical protein